jgi:hypothetical protein
MAFLELFVDKAPQLIQLMKGQRLKNASLQNRLTHALNKSDTPVVPDVADDSSVLDRMTGGNRNQPNTKTASQARLDQLKAAQTRPTAGTAGDPQRTPAPAPELPAAPAPGEIGALNIPTVNPTAPAATTAPELPDASGQPITTEPEPTTPQVSEGEATDAAGSKSEPSSDDGVQSEDAAGSDGESQEELTEDEKKALLGQPTADDLETVGSKAARKGTVKKVPSGNK